MSERIFHVATLADWEEALRTGSYTTSTRGRTLAQEGFIHASRADQWEGVRARFYADVREPLVLLAIDPDRLGVPVVEETVPDSTETFPHVYGAIPATAVVDVRRLDGSFSGVFLGEVLGNALLGLAVIVCAAVGVGLGGLVDDTWGPWLGLVVGLVAGLALAVSRHRQSAGQ